MIFPFVPKEASPSFWLFLLVGTSLIAALIAVMSGTVTLSVDCQAQAKQSSFSKGGFQRRSSMFGLTKKAFCAPPSSTRNVSSSGPSLTYASRYGSRSKCGARILCTTLCFARKKPNAHPRFVIVRTDELAHCPHHLRVRSFSDTLDDSLHRIPFRQVGGQLQCANYVFTQPLKCRIRWPNCPVFDVQPDVHDQEPVWLSPSVWHTTCSAPNVFLQKQLAKISNVCQCDRSGLSWRSQHMPQEVWSSPHHIPNRFILQVLVRGGFFPNLSYSLFRQMWHLHFLQKSCFGRFQHLVEKLMTHLLVPILHGPAFSNCCQHGLTVVSLYFYVLSSFSTRSSLFAAMSLQTPELVDVHAFHIVEALL